MSKSGLIYETQGSIKDLKVSESSSGLMTLSGVFGVCGIRNNNHRVYERKNYAKMVGEVQARIKENGGIPGTLEHENSMYINLENVSHKITKVDIDESGVVTGEIQLLNTPKGKIAQAIVEGGLPLFISSRAMGQVDKSGNVTLERISGWDLVSQPGFSEARLHLNESQVMESLGDNCCVVLSEKNNINESDMEMKELLEKFEAMEARIETLENENKQLQEQLSSTDNSELLEGIQNWVVEQVAPEIQNWLEQEYQSAAQEATIKECKEIICNQVAPKIQEWVVEHFAPEIEGWIVEQYSPQVENWVIKQVAPGIQEWMVESFAPEIENWVTESFGTSVKDMIAESLESSKETKLQSIKDTLNLLESMEVHKPQFGSRVITESSANEPAYIANMPETARVKYNMASQEIKESIDRRARIFDFSNEGAIERFWESVNFEEIKPVTSVYEGLENIQDVQERAIRAAFRRKRAQF